MYLRAGGRGLRPGRHGSRLRRAQSGPNWGVGRRLLPRARWRRPISPIANYETARTRCSILQRERRLLRRAERRFAAAGQRPDGRRSRAPTSAAMTCSTRRHDMSEGASAWFLRQARGGFAGQSNFATGANPRQIASETQRRRATDIAVDEQRQCQRHGAARATPEHRFPPEPSRSATARRSRPRRLQRRRADRPRGGQPRHRLVSVLLRNAHRVRAPGRLAGPVGGGSTGITPRTSTATAVPTSPSRATTACALTVATGGITPIPRSRSPARTASPRPTSTATPPRHRDHLADHQDAVIVRGPAPPPPYQTPTPTPPVATPTPTPRCRRRSRPASTRRRSSGKVKVKLPGTKNYIDLSQAANLPVGTTVDTRDGRVDDPRRRARRPGGLLRRDLQDQPDEGHAPVDLAHADRDARAVRRRARRRSRRRRRSPASCGATARARSGRSASTARRPCGARRGS